ncbi:hypothetical protein GCM10022222_37630 [Amycolatopsis ultiminotia]|uniref:HTH merR-type domain-containing protein n=1 Tax=Amycolatopsis ultiminotia TaxID=543629 RepID=A0ABP6WFL0_9PSEU
MAAIVGLNVGMKSTLLPIGEVADRFGLPAHVLRHWESVGLLAPSRVEGRQRRYGADDLYRVAVILRAKEAGLGLDDIRSMIATSNPGERRSVLLRQREELRLRMAGLSASLELIECALDCDHEDFTQCARFRAVVADRLGIEAGAAPPAGTDAGLGGTRPASALRAGRGGGDRRGRETACGKLAT